MHWQPQRPRTQCRRTPSTQQINLILSNQTEYTCVLTCSRQGILERQDWHHTYLSCTGKGFSTQTETTLPHLPHPVAIQTKHCLLSKSYTRHPKNGSCNCTVSSACQQPQDTPGVGITHDRHTPWKVCHAYGCTAGKAATSNSHRNKLVCMSKCFQRALLHNAMDSCHCKLTDLEHLSEGDFSLSNLPASIPALHILC